MMAFVLLGGLLIWLVACVALAAWENGE